MSLISLATRVVLARLLVGRTWAGQVLDQPLDPISEILRASQQPPKPVIAIYTGQAKGEPVGHETQGGPQAVRTMVYVYLPPSRIDLPDGVQYSIDNVGSGLALAVLGRQIDAAMHFGAAAWLEIWRGFVLQVEERIARFVLVEVQGGVRVPCMEVIYDCRCVADADFGKPIYGAWQKMDALLRADGVGSEGAKLADLIKDLIEAPTGLHPYEIFQGNFGLGKAPFMVTGLAPLATDDEDGSAPLLEDVDFVPPLP